MKTKKIPLTACDQKPKTRALKVDRSKNSYTQDSELQKAIFDKKNYRLERKTTKKELKDSVKEEIQANSLKKPDIARKTSKKGYQQAKKEYKLVKKDNKENLKSKDKKIKYEAKSEVFRKKQIKIKHKKVYRDAKKKDTTRIAYQGKAQAKLTVKTKIQQAIQQDEDFGTIIDQYYRIQRTRQGLQTSLRIGKNIAKVTSKLGKSSYGLGNRTYNWVRGQGFQRTPKSLTARSKIQRKYQRLKNQRRIAKQAKKAERGINLIKQVISGKKTLAQATLALAHNPFLLVFFILFLICGLFASTAASSQKPAIVQEEADLTECWEYMTKIDAEKSDEENHFYTALDDVMYYMNYKYEDYQLKDKKSLTQTYQQFFDTLWEDLNGKLPNYRVKTMEDLMKQKNSPYFLGKQELEEYHEMVSELGYKTLSGQLEFPFETDVLSITRRYGYERSEKEVHLFNKIEVSTTEGLAIMAPLTGTIEAVPSSTSIQILDAFKSRLVIEGVDTSRIVVGQQVQAKQFLGKATSSKLSICYEKYDEEKGKRYFVNPAFYFPKVTYAQVTYLSSEDFDPGKSKLSRAKKVYEYLSKRNYTKEGICAILGCFDIESSIQAKRAEGDYLAPPVGASPSSWDDPNWLAMGGMEIYGKYPNILHRGLGLGQWTDTSDGSTRHTLLLEYAKAKKKKWYNLALQLDFMLNGDAPAYRIRFKNVASSKIGKSIPELTTYFLSYWEGNPGDKLQMRIQSAQDWYNYFSNPSNCMQYKLPVIPANISSGFGSRDFGGSQEFHRGLDFAVPQGTPIHAIADGEVVKAEYHYSWGNYVQIKHADNTSSLYAHQSEIKVKAGQKIKQGDVIGLVGSTGNSTGPHLHLEYSISTDMSRKNLRDPAELFGLK